MAYDKTVFPRIYKQIERIGVSEFGWRDVNIHYATLNSLVKRGYLQNNNGTYSVTPLGHQFAEIENRTKGVEYFCLRREGETLGMLCYIKGADIYDAFDRVFTIGSGGVLLSFHKPNSKEVFIG